MKSIVTRFIRLYQRILSPDQGLLRFFFTRSSPRCNMYPSCSEYMVLAVEKYGVLKGVAKGVARVFRCHPYQKKLIDLP